MKHTPKIIQLDGLQGILLVVFTMICLGAGFIIFPGYMACAIWNYLAGYAALPFINLFQGVLLWSIIVIAGYIILSNGKKQIIAVKAPQELDEEELQAIMKIIRSQNKIQKPLLIKTHRLKKYEIKEVTKFSDICGDSEDSKMQNKDQ